MWLQKNRKFDNKNSIFGTHTACSIAHTLQTFNSSETTSSFSIMILFLFQTLCISINNLGVTKLSRRQNLALETQSVWLLN